METRIKRRIIPIVLILSILWNPTVHSQITPSNLSLFHLSPKQQTFLLRHGFLETPSHKHNFVDIYKEINRRNQPAFITTDSILHIAHILFDYSLRIIELKKLYPEVAEFTERMLKDSEQQYMEITNPELKRLARLNVGFFSVPEKILNPSYNPPYKLGKLVKKELKHIREHKGLMLRALLPYISNPSLIRTPYAYEDYTQYLPRGHYTRNPIFKKYFKVMMWYGRMDFKLRPGKSQNAIEDGRKMTLQALLMAYAIKTDKKAQKLYFSIYRTTTFFTGASDDLTPEEYITLMEKVYGNITNPNELEKPKKLATFIKNAMKLRPPQIFSGILPSRKVSSLSATKGFKIMGQRFIPDSYILQKLVFNSVGKFLGTGHPFTLGCIPNVGCVRVLPRGLDVMATLGSKEALQIMTFSEDTNYQYYTMQLKKTKQWLLSRPVHIWLSNLYWMWFYSLKTLLNNNLNIKQPFENKLWHLKELQTALGSWTELRHDTILYAKQSYTFVSTSIPQPFMQSRKPVCGYVEPYPQLYSRLLTMTSELQCVASYSVPNIPTLSKKLERFEDVLSVLKRISLKEIKEIPLSKNDYSFIRHTASTLKQLTTFQPNIMKAITSNTDTQVALVADVHTSPSTYQVLEEAIGNPYNIYVIVKDNKGTRVCRGAVFSYYEFKSSMSHRLTDEEWHKLMYKKRPPKWARKLTAY